MFQGHSNTGSHWLSLTRGTSPHSLSLGWMQLNGDPTYPSHTHCPAWQWTAVGWGLSIVLITFNIQSNTLWVNTFSIQIASSPSFCSVPWPFSQPNMVPCQGEGIHRQELCVAEGQSGFRSMCENRDAKEKGWEVRGCHGELYFYLK